MEKRQAFRRKNLSQIDLSTGEIIEGTAFLLPNKAKLREDFMLLMQDAAIRIAKDREITGTDHRVLWYLIGKVNFENYVICSQTTIGADLNIKKQQVSRSIKKLADKRMLVREDINGIKVYRLNAFYGWKGKVNKTYQSTIENHLQLIVD